MTDQPQARPDHGPRTVSIDEVVDLDGPEVDLQPLLEAIADRDVEVGVFTDEQLHWTSPDPDADPDPIVDAPRLARLTPAEQTAALAATMWLLLARDEARWDGHRLMLRARHAIVAELRQQADHMTLVQVDGPAHTVAAPTAVIYRNGPELFTVEHVAAEGLHHLWCCGLDGAARRLASLLDPLDLATRSQQPAPVEPDDRARLAAAATTKAAVLSGRRAGSQVAHTGVAVLGTDQGLYVVQDDTGRQVAQALSPSDLVAYCTRLLTDTANEPAGPA